MNHVLFVNKSSSDVLPFLPFAEHKGIKVSTAYSIQEALALTQPNNDIDVVISDLHLPDGNALELLSKRAKEEDIISTTSTSYYFIAEKSDKEDKELVKHAKTLGAQGFLHKPLTIRSLEKILTSDKPILKSVKEMPDHHIEYHFANFVGKSEAMQKLYRVIQRVAPTSASVFVIGKSGTGKELIAQAIHQHSARHTKPYLPINCAAIAPDLICSALFGHEKGSFTGAVQSHVGYFEQASGGTLFLDEITETSLDFQVKLLRLLETGVVIPVGGRRQVHVDVRIIASTNRCPKLAVKKGLLREDLYYRLNVFPIHVPVLNDREGDIALLAKHFLALNNQTEGKYVQFTKAALDMIQNHHYAGNVRELKNLIHRAFILADGYIDVDHIQAYAIHDQNDMKSALQLPSNLSLKEAADRYVQHVYQQCCFDKKLTAQTLEVSDQILNSYLGFAAE
ncbi:MAG: sigma-54-dependent Fis family transcriptional regulator [Gammaproteobacteria bacterium]|jgi:DNA-binding NtrC family response regulator|nr:sigma-54-dependent Fis family transcriptional regulator [Gammaproteobacteria bacterium]